MIPRFLLTSDLVGVSLIFPALCSFDPCSLYKIMAQSSSNVSEYCGIVKMELFVLLLKRCDPKKSQILTPESTSIFSSDG